MRLRKWVLRFHVFDRVLASMGIGVEYVYCAMH